MGPMSCAVWQSRGLLERALVGCFGTHQRFLVAQQLDHLDFLDERIAQISAENTTRTQPLATAVSRLDAIPGVGQRTAEVLGAEVGTNMERFPTADHLASWAGMCPGNRQSAGRQLNGKTRKGSPWLRAALAECRAIGRAHQGLFPPGAVPAVGGTAG
jgi:transposase